MDRQGREQPIAAESRQYIYPRTSPDGKRIALDAQETGRNIWMWDLEHDILTRLTPEADKADRRAPIWSPDGRSIIYSSTESGRASFLRRSADGAGEPDRLLEVAGNQNAVSSIAPDGSSLVYLVTENNRTSGDLMMLPLSGQRRPQPLLPAPSEGMNGEIAPSGRWIAYESIETGRSEIYVRPFPDVTTGRWQVSSTGGTRPAWSRDGRELFYVAADRRLMAVAVDARPTFTYGRPGVLFDLRPYFMGLAGRTYDVAADGRFVLVKEPQNPVTTQQTIVVVEHWLDEVRARVSK